MVKSKHHRKPTGGRGHAEDKDRREFSTRNELITRRRRSDSSSSRRRSLSDRTSSRLKEQPISKSRSSQRSPRANASPARATGTPVQTQRFGKNIGTVRGNGSERNATFRQRLSPSHSHGSTGTNRLGQNGTKKPDGIERILTAATVLITVAWIVAAAYNVRLYAEVGTDDKEHRCAGDVGKGGEGGRKETSGISNSGQSTQSTSPAMSTEITSPQTEGQDTSSEAATTITTQSPTTEEPTTTETTTEETETTTEETTTSERTKTAKPYYLFTTTAGQTTETMRAK